MKESWRILKVCYILYHVLTVLVLFQFISYKLLYVTVSRSLVMKDQTMKEMLMKEIEIFLDGHDSSIFRMDRCVYMKNIHLVFCQMVSYNYFPVNWNFQFNPYCQQIIGEFPGHNLCRISQTILLENSFKGSSD